MKGIKNIVSNLQKQHEEEINLLNNQHKEVVQELLKQSQLTEINHKETIKETHKQVKYALRAFIVAIIALIVTIVWGVLQYTHYNLP